MASVSRVLSSQDGRKAPEAGSLVWGDPALETAVTVKAESCGGTEWDLLGGCRRGGQTSGCPGVPQDVPPRVLTRAAQAPLPYEVRRKATTASAATALPCEQIKTIPVFFVCLFARSTKDTFFGMP